MTGQEMVAHNKGKGRAIRWIRDHVGHAGDDCLPWPMARDDKGHGILGWNGAHYKAARLMCEFAHGAPPTPEHETAHSCGKGHEGCMNPQHLSWKTRSGNQQDRFAHGTVRKPGERGRSKLTPEQIDQIRAIGTTKTQREIAQIFNCTPSNISKVQNGVRWKKTPQWFRARLTSDDLDTIRNAKGTKTLAEVARKFDVSTSTVWRIQSGAAYAHIPRDGEEPKQ